MIISFGFRSTAPTQRLLAHLLRRTDNWAGAVPIWESTAKQGCMESIERLAKYHEHISKDLQAAWQYCEQLPGSGADLHRRNRLWEKLADDPRTGALRLVVWTAVPIDTGDTKNEDKNVN